MVNRKRAAWGKRYGLDQRRSTDKLIGLLALVCAGLLSADLLLHKHVHFFFEQWFGFFAGFGFFCCVGLVLLSRQLRRIVKRDEDYYD